MIALIGFTIVGLVYSVRILLEALAILITLSLIMLGAILGLLKMLVVIGRGSATKVLFDPDPHF